MKSHSRVETFALEHPWALTKYMMPVVASIIARHIAGVSLMASDLKAVVNDRRDLPPPRSGVVGVLPVYGVIAPKANQLTEVSGATSLDKLTAQFRALMADDSVTTIVLDVDSGGGNVAGVTEFAREVMRARTRKPIVAVANFTMASAAYWIAAAATEIIASPSARVGSIGVMTMHEDLSKALESEGIKRTYISAGKHKLDGSETEPLSDETYANIQATVDEVYDVMVTDIAHGRGVKAADVRSGYGEGDVVSAAQALALGMVDKIGTFDETLARLTGGGRRRSLAAETIPLPMVADNASVTVTQAVYAAVEPLEGLEAWVNKHLSTEPATSAEISQTCDIRARQAQADADGLLIALMA